jgi:hypothetical protein
MITELRPDQSSDSHHTLESCPNSYTRVDAKVMEKGWRW